MSESNKTLAVMLAEKNEYEALLEDVKTYDSELEAIWADNNVAIARKVDATYMVLKDIENKIQYLKDEKKIIDSVNKSAQNEIERIKARLYDQAQQLNKGEALRGDKHSFHPYISVNREVDLGKVEFKYKSYTIEKLTYDEYTILCNAFDFFIDSEIPENKKETVSSTGRKLSEVRMSCNVTDLPEGHPAIIEKVQPSVRIR